MLAWVWIIPALPLAAAALLGLAGNRAARWAGLASSATVAAALGLAVRVLLEVAARPKVFEASVPWLSTAGGLQISAGFLVDPLAALMLVLVTFVSLMVQVYSLGYMATDPGKPRYFAFLSLFTFAMLGLVIANNLVLMYIAWELVGLCSYLLIGFWYQRPEAANAAKKAFVVTRFGDMGFLIGVLVVGFTLNSFNLLDLSMAVKTGKLAGGVVTAVALLIFAGAAGKSAQFPLHVWLPDAMEGPTPVSALIHAATMVAAGVFLVARLFPLYTASPTALNLVAWVGGFTALVAATIACVQNDIKRILAFSTLSQLGYMMMALGCGGYSAGLFHLTTHAAYKALLFLCAGSVIHALHTNDIWQMGGLRRRMGVTAAVTLIGVLAMAGIFPFAGFFSKDAVLAAALSAQRLDLLVVGLVTALLTSFYAFRLFFVVFTGSAATAHEAHESPAVMTWPMLLLAVLAAGLGVLAQPAARFLGAAFGAPAAGEVETTRLIPVLATFAALLGLGWAYVVYFQKAISASLLARRFGWVYTLVKNKYYVDEFYAFLVRQVMFVISRGLAWFDRHVVDGAVNGVAWLCRMSGEGASRLQLGRLQAYLLMFTAALILIVVLMVAANPGVLAWAR
jgi:NADH-quinone oxidoreductase subunit L